MFTRESKIILAITGLSHFSVHSSMLIFPPLIYVLRKEYGVDIDTLGWIYMLSNLMFGLGAIPAGWIERKIGGRRLLLLYHLGVAFSCLLVVISRDLKFLTIALMSLGLFNSIYHPAGLTIISRRIRQTARAMGYHGIAGSSGLALGPLFASWFAVNLSWRMAYGAIMLFSLMLVIATALLIPAKQMAIDEEDAAKTDETKLLPLFMYYTIIVLIGLTFYGFSTYMPIHFSENTDGVLEGLDIIIKGGFFSTLVLIAGIPGQLLGGKWGDKFDRTLLLQLIILVHIPLLISFGYARGEFLVLTGIFLGMVHFMFQPVGNSLIAQLTSSNSRGLGYGVSFFLSFGVGSIAAGVGGNLAVNYGVSIVFPFIAALMGLAFVMSLFLRRVL